ncbi:MAG TPA: cytochrome c oxidase assembly protein [Acidobacteriaceae bacterium]|nr:cytochrome c oxidase assembly protein [Acidobacteriaceae bacterium]
MSDAASQAIWASWSFPFWATAGLLLTALVYLRGWRKIRQTRPLIFPPWRMGCFLSGLLALWIALASPLNTLDSLLLFVHMTQHLILMSVVPPLLLLGAPAVPLLRGLPQSTLREGLGPFLRTPVLHRVIRFLTHPVFAWLAMNLTYIAWHIPQAYELALRSPRWHEVEHGCFLGTSLLFWFPIIQPWPSVSRGSRWLLVPYLVGADLINTAVAGFLTFVPRVVYPSYAAAPRIFGISALGDQAAAGALMWVLGSILFLVPLGVIVIQLLSPQTRRAATASVRRGRVATQTAQRVDLLRLPLVGHFLRWRYGRMVLQSVAFAAAVLVIVEGFRGPSMGAMNLAGVFPWTYVRAFGVIALLVLGNIFCLSCPFMLPREIGHRLGLARFRWPQWLRTKWLAILLMIVFFWSYEAFAIWDHPQRTAWLLIAYFAAAFVVDTFFRGANFCKYVCPLGQFNFSGSLLSPFGLQVRSQTVCGQCKTHDCIAGNQQHRGCELQLYMPQKAGNMDCTLCLDCVHACPHDNIGLLALSPVHDLLRDPVRSSIGKLSSRVDIAVLALVVVLAAFANAWLMVAPVAKYVALLALAAVVTVVVLLFMAKYIQPEKKELFCRFAQALLPLGLAMWAAHLLFHLFTGWETLGPTIRQAAADFGWHALGSPHWGMQLPLLNGDSTLSLQLLVLDAGLLLSLYLGWRLAQQRVHSPGRAVLLLLPWAGIVAAAYAAGVWILLQPMQMRGMIMNS